MNGSEKRLQAISLFAIVILSIITIDLLNENEEESEIVYVMIDNRITIDDNYTIEELDRSEVARVASFNIRIFGDTKMSNQTVVAELVDIFQRYDMVAVQEIKDIDEKFPNEKILVFSQFIRMLDLIEFRLKQEYVACIKLTGS